MRFEYPEELPVSGARDAIRDAVTHSQVVIVSGQTGSGKTTQLPKILLEMGRGTHGHQIVHTQPRRLAAHTVAERIAQELGVRLGDEVGYQVRFTDESSPSTRLRVVTDGILLAQIQRDPKLGRYDTIVIDEAHERTLNIDFLLGYLTALLPQRPELKLIITSATIDSEKFASHFEQALGKPVPVIEVSGRTYPVTICYEPPDGPPSLMAHVPGFTETAPEPHPQNRDQDAMDMPTAVARACMELVTVSAHDQGPRDLLVFAAGERDIHDYEQAIRRAFGARCADLRRPDAIEIMPLFARLSAKEQHRVFESHTHQRIVIATNVAETSLTVPGIRYVVDPGMARISRYSKASKVQRLPIEPISQASADQRSGRCGRIADGIAIRLYSAEDYETRPRFTEPEILRTSLGSVVLHMLSVGVAHTAQDVTDFGFIDPPDMKAVADGFHELTELQAIERKRGAIRLTKVGRQLSRIPIDVRLGRMLIEAARSTTPNTLAAVIVVVAFLSLQDPRERPEEVRDEATRIHNRYADAGSDFLTALNIWDRAYGADGEMSNHALRKLCKAEYLHFLRMRQWKDLVTQLRALCKELHFTVGEPLPVSRPDPAVRALPLAQQAMHSLCCTWDSDGIHHSMLAGLLSMMGMQVVREPKASDYAHLRGAARARALKRAQRNAHNDYQGSRGMHFAIFPASSVNKSTPPWVMSTELVETSRLWARYCAQIDPAWAEPLARGLTRTTYAEPHWSGSRGSAVAEEKVLLYGLPIVQGRHIQWGRVNPAEARDFLIRQGLVEGDIQQRFPGDEFVKRNLDILEDAQDDANRTRQVALAVSDEDLFDFYDHVIPDDVTSVAALAHWWKDERSRQPGLLEFDPAKVERLSDQDGVDLSDFPDHWHTVGPDGRPISLRLSYIYDTNDEADGVTVHVPLTVLSLLDPAEFTWNVPGLHHELITAMIKALPKHLRVQFVPAPDTARRIGQWLDEHWPDAPGSGTREHPAAAPDGGPWPDFMHVFTKAAIQVVGAQIHPEVLDGLDARLAPYLKPTFAIEQPAPRGKRGRGGRKALATGKDLAALQRRFAAQAQASARKVVERKAAQAGQEGKVVERADLLHKAGATGMSREDMLWHGALDRLRLPAERISSRWLGAEALRLASAPYPSTKALVEDLQLAAVKRLLPDIGKLSTDAELDQAVEGVREVYEDTVYDVAKDTATILEEYAKVERAVSGPADLPMLSVLQSIREHLAELVHEGFLGEVPPYGLRRIPIYLRADAMRLNKAKADKNRDVRWAWQADEVRQLVDKAMAKARDMPTGETRDTAIDKATHARWMLEEFRVSLWAQELGTTQPVSIQRITKALR
ncbi:ATP-dependent RNA helicase HrpA [Bifidobacterium cuniculi]|uniref:HrpA protein n=1 Tax=Bifidobacterium cuniculi TaxID=1688 RepID=A0A087B3E5_9BIFI|nr:ATP-dependent RNA helicase HrpA [Bifidobacterium cuniculi]KFI65545.1 HrpA protein [Bifidobacterium cuniculi]